MRKNRKMLKKGLAIGLAALGLLSSCAHEPTAERPVSSTDLARTAVPPAEKVTPEGDTSEAAELPENVVQMLRQKAFDAYRQGDYPRAITHWETALLVGPPGIEPWTKYLLCYCYMVTGRYAEAKALAETLVKEDPYQPLPYQQLGIAQLWLGKAKPALENLQRALDFDSHAPRAHFYVGLAYAQLGQTSRRDDAFTLGVKEYEEILRKNPTDFSANYELASLLLFWNHDLERAALLLSQAKGHFGNAPEAELEGDRKLFQNYYLPLLEGIVLYRKGDAAGARQALIRAMSSLPSDAKADVAELYFYLGNTYAALGAKPTAKIFLEKAKASDPSGPYAPATTKAIRELASRRSTSP